MYVVGLLLFGREGGTQQGDGGLVCKVAGDAQRAEIGAEQVLLLAVEVDLEVLHVLHRTEVGLTVLGGEVVVVL